MALEHQFLKSCRTFFSRKTISWSRVDCLTWWLRKSSSRLQICEALILSFDHGWTCEWVSFTYHSKVSGTEETTTWHLHRFSQRKLCNSPKGPGNHEEGAELREGQLAWIRDDLMSNLATKQWYNEQQLMNAAWRGQGDSEEVGREDWTPSSVLIWQSRLKNIPCAQQMTRHQRDHMILICSSQERNETPDTTLMVHYTGRDKCCINCSVDVSEEQKPLVEKKKQKKTVLWAKMQFWRCVILRKTWSMETSRCANSIQMPVWRETIDKRMKSPTQEDASLKLFMKARDGMMALKGLCWHQCHQDMNSQKSPVKRTE